MEPLEAERMSAMLMAENERLRLELAEARVTAAENATTLLLADGSRVGREELVFKHPPVPGRVSVVIPAYNAEAFIERAVESVWGQTLDADRIELLIVDDGSTDRTAMLCKGLAHESPVRMRLLQHRGRKNSGVSASRQLACTESTGEFIALLDADDLFLPNRLQRGIDALQTMPEAPAVCSLGINVDMKGEPTTGYNGSGIAGDWVALGGELAPPFDFEQLWQATPIANSSLTLRRSAVQEVGGYPRLMAHQAEDWLLVLKLSLLSPIPCIEEQLMLYTHHPGAYTAAYAELGLHEGARIEVFYHLAWWMLRHAKYAPRGMRFFRQEYPKLIADHQRLLPLVRSYSLAGGNVAQGSRAFESYIGGLYDETMALQRVASAKLSENRVLRELLQRDVGENSGLVESLQVECDTLHRVLTHVIEENRRLRAVAAARPEQE
jgi:glycosyltransferase involved in cell wall biosynthesis